MEQRFLEPSDPRCRRYLRSVQGLKSCPMSRELMGYRSEHCAPRDISEADLLRKRRFALRNGNVGQYTERLVRTASKSRIRDEVWRRIVQTGNAETWALNNKVRESIF